MKIKLLGTLAVVLGVFLCVGVASASDTDILQPASMITYNDSVDVNGTIYANSAYIGEPGVGGVTFFNGTIINNSEAPVTFGDDVRIDGEIYRIQKGGDPLKISDNVIPTANNMNDFGSSANRWNEVFTKDISISGNIIPVTQSGWDRSNSDIGAPDKKIKQIWTDGLNVRGLYVNEQIVFPNGDINGTGEEISIFAENDNDISLYAPGNKVIINDNTRLKFSILHTNSYTCNASHEGEAFYDTGLVSDHRLVICDYRISDGGYKWRPL